MKITVSTIIDLYKDDDGELQVWEMDDQRNIVCSTPHADENNDWDCLYTDAELLKCILEEFPDAKLGNYFFYVEFTAIGYSTATMDGTEYDVDYEIEDQIIKFYSEPNEDTDNTPS